MEYSILNPTNLVIFIGTVIYFFISYIISYIEQYYDNKYKKLQEVVHQYQQQQTTDKIHPLDGIFEIHITVENKYAQLLQFTQSYSRSLKLVHAVSSCNN